MNDEARSAVLYGPQQRADRAYWQNLLQKARAGGTLPTDRRRSAIPLLEQRSTSVSLPREVASRVGAVAKGSPLLTLATLGAGVLVCLHRYEERGRVSFGTPTHGADRPQVLPIAVDIAGVDDFRSLLAAVRSTVVDAQKHTSVPVGSVHAGATSEAAPVGVILPFDVRLDLAGLSDEVPPLGNDLSLLADVDGPSVRLTIRYHHRLFGEEAVRRFVGHLGSVLGQGLEALDAPMAVIELPTAAERTTLIERACPRPVEDDDATVHGLLAAQAQRTPDGIALQQGSSSLTYRELMRSAGRVSATLREHGVGLDDVVAVRANRSSAALTTITGVLLAGAAYLPLDPTTPAERATAMLRAAGVRLVLTDLPTPQLEDMVVLPLAGTSEVCLEDPVKIPATAPASMIFTSGSTGEPKGVEMPHRALVNLVKWQRRQSDEVHDGTIRTLARSPLWFDVSFQEVYATLCFGGTVVVADAGEEKDPAALVALVINQQITRAFFPFVGLQQFLVEVTRRKLRLPDMRELITSGEQLKRTSALVAFFRTNTTCVLRNQYGPTETHVVTSHTLDGPPTRWPDLPPIGAPIDGAHVHVVDDLLRPVPVGVTGELCVAGTPLANGYRGDAETTAVQFVRDGHDFGGRLYRTGDLARRHEDGTIMFLGRRDRQLKIRGHRVEPGEVEAALMRHHAVAAAAVVSSEDAAGTTRLVAHVVPASSFHADVDLRGHLSEFLPEHAVPSTFSVIAALPLTDTGKVNVEALPEPSEDRSAPEDRFIAPRTPLEEEFAGIWRRLLGVERVGVSDHFLELGGDSIIATQAVAAANDLGFAITMRDFFSHPTVAEQCALAPQVGGARVERADDDREAPLTPVQRWFTELDLPVADHWNFAVILSSEERLDRDAIEQALGSLVRRHEALGASFSAGSTMSGRTAPGSSVTEVSVPSEARIADVVAEQAGLAHARIDRRTGPLVTATVMHADGATQDRLLIVSHHLVVDGVSWRVLLEDLQTLYRSVRNGTDPALPVRSSSYQEWAHGLTRYAGSEAALAEMGHWSAIVNREAPVLPIDESGREADSRRVHVSLTAQESSVLLQELPTGCRARIEEILLSCLFEGIHSWTGDRSMRVQFEGHGRESVLPELDLTRTVGWFSTMYPVDFRVDDDVDVTSQSVLGAVKDSMRAVPNRGIGHGVLRYLSPDPAVRDALAAAGPPQIGFNYLGRFDAQFDSDSTFRPASEPVGPMVHPGSERPWPLYFQGHVVDGRAHFFLEYPHRRVSPAAMTAVVERFESSLRRLISQRGLGSDDTPAVDLSASEMDTLLSEITSNDP